MCTESVGRGFFSLCAAREGSTGRCGRASVCAEVGSPPKTNGLFRYVYILEGIRIRLIFILNQYIK